MLELDISKQCQEEWNRALDISLYENPDDELINLLDRIISHNSTQEDIKKTVVKLARIFNVKITNVIFISDEKANLVGGFDKNNNSIVFNFSLTNTFETQGVDLLATIVHELRHAQQYQQYQYIDNDLGRTIKDNIRTYRCSTASMADLSTYYTNFIEVDAEVFAHKYTRHLLEKVKEKKNIPYSAQASLEHRISNSLTSIETSRELIHYNRKAFELVYTSLEKYAKSVLPAQDLTIEQKNELANNLLKEIEPIIDGNGKEMFGFTLGRLHYLQDLIYEDVDPFTILDNLDSDFIKYIEKLETKYRDHGLNRSHKYSEHLKSIVTKCEDLLISKKIPFNKNNPSETVKKAFEVLPSTILENIRKPHSEYISKLENLLLSISVYMPKQSKNLMNYTRNLIEETIPKEKLTEYLEKNVDADKDIYYCGPYEICTNLLDRYYSDYRAETFSHSREKLLTTMGVKYKKGNFYDIREKFNQAYSRFLAKCLFKTNLSPEEKGYIVGYELGSYRDIDKDILEKEIRKTLFFQSKLSKILEENNHPVLKAFEKRGLDLRELIKSKQNKKNVN